ncbi:MAG: hypothetical protein JXA49_03680 [Actinobacteria bacterium]|nr:hypothetical protein [Actinomycetota bacterium]
MANKRIELERYKYYVRIGDEEPNRKRAARGATISLIASMLLVVFFLVLGVSLSSKQASNPGVVLETPAPATDGAIEDGGFNEMNQEGMPLDFNTPENQVTPVMPEQSPTPDQSMAPRNGRLASGSTGIPAAGPISESVWGEGLLAQAEPAGEGEENGPGIEVQPIDNPIDQPQETSPVQQGTLPAETRQKGPDQQTKGVGNLANLAELAGGRGFQLYILITTIFLLIVIYMALSRIRGQRKTN